MNSNQLKNVQDVEELSSEEEETNMEDDEANICSSEYVNFLFLLK